MTTYIFNMLLKLTCDRIYTVLNTIFTPTLVQYSIIMYILLVKSGMNLTKVINQKIQGELIFVLALFVAQTIILRDIQSLFFKAAW
jgi:hypothetical protein